MKVHDHRFNLRYDGNKIYTATDGAELAYIPPGEFTMGISDAMIARWMTDTYNDSEFEFSRHAGTHGVFEWLLDR